MTFLHRFGTLSRKGGLTLAASLMLATGPAFAQEQPSDDQAQEPMDVADIVTISCQDGTELHGVFTEAGVDLTLTDGKKVSLPEAETEEGFSFTNGAYTLAGDEETLSFTTGKKAPVACDIKDDGPPSKFDAPLFIDTEPLPADKANPDIQPQVNCYRFPGYMVKEVDLGEKGAESLSIAPQTAACKKDAGKDEKPVKDETAGYFLGSKGKFVFFQAPDSVNGGLPFVVYDQSAMKRLFEDAFAGQDFYDIAVDGDKITLTFDRVYSASCSLYSGDATCLGEVKRATGLGEVAPIPDCKAEYDQEKQANPDAAAEIDKVPSVVTYKAKLVWDGAAAAITPEAGPTVCHLAS
ncbi:hypothetical protein [Rhizobium sp. TRM95796]|uniref:hypothetical protein n=1 Tax=Rhizobium sp. TRM95796 TaxID=2979862 RepID=UPI0021E8C80C|nr:hypothetical protein [Rhizobium sp. TRM95796]MCV3768500.1 hypothetical protein [Rhizobium sp. TRM95796]